MVMRGYFEDPAATAAVIDSDGWLHTGDLASRDASGHWQIVGRLKDMIIRGGENIYPAQVEAAIRRHPGVNDAQVVGVPSDYYGEEAIAFVQPRAAATVEPAEVRAFLVHHLAPHEIPREIRLVDSFPDDRLGQGDQGAPARARPVQLGQAGRVERHGRDTIA